MPVIHTRRRKYVLAGLRMYIPIIQMAHKLSDNKGNFIRLWMPSWGLGIE